METENTIGSQQFGQAGGSSGTEAPPPLCPTLSSTLFSRQWQKLQGMESLFCEKLLFRSNPDERLSWMQSHLTTLQEDGLG